MLSVQEAQNWILQAVNRMGPHTVHIADALKCVLAQDIVSPADVPPFDNSAMDGYAVRSVDTAKARSTSPVRLTIKATVRAGDRLSFGIEKGECSKIMTGAEIPDGTDSVVMVEDVEAKENQIFVRTPVPKGKHIRRKGEDIKRSEVVLKSGTLLRPPEIGVLASLGLAHISVVRRPVVALATTGDELVEIDEPLSPGKIRDSNRYSLRALIMETGCTPLELGIIPDKREEMENTFKEALQKSDLLMTTGGVSMGQYDLVRDVLSSIGKYEFWKVNMKPGKPLAFGTADGKPIFGLPGNPVSCMVCFELFARPALMKMRGEKKFFKEKLSATATCPIDKQKGRAEFKRGKVRREEDTLVVDVTGPQGSGILTSMVKANCLVYLPEEVGPISTGEKVSVIPL